MPQQGVASQRVNSKQPEINWEESSKKSREPKWANRTCPSGTSPQIRENRKVAEIRQGIMEAR